MIKRYIVTLDGPAGVGKSTLAKQTAEALHLAYLDTGAMFRAIALELAPLITSYKANAPTLASALQAELDKFHFGLQGTGKETILVCNGMPVGAAIRTEEAAALAATIAVIPVVREYLKLAQQRLGQTTPLVAEGRDMGTEVFPAACCKFFLDASITVRAERRYQQLINMNLPADLAELTKQISERDHQDRTRTIAPLRAAPDAVIIDTSPLSIEQVLQTILVEVKKHTPQVS